MLTKKSDIFFIIAFSILISGCRPIDWGTKTFYQGCKPEKCGWLCRPREYIRTLRVYDQFTTLGIFNAMWLSDEVFVSYANLYAQKYSLNEEATLKLFEKKVCELNGLLSFYVLAYSPGTTNVFGMKTKSTVIKDTPWDILLKVNGKAYRPVAIKKIELNPEFKVFFGQYVTAFKTPYLVQFAVQDDCGNCLINADTGSIILCLSADNRRAAMSWCIDKCGKLINKDYDCCLHDNDETCKVCSCIKVDE